MAAPNRPLKFKRHRSEIVFRRDAVRDVVLSEAPPIGRYRGRNVVPQRIWRLDVNGIRVFSGKESAARKQYERALRYVA